MVAISNLSRFSRRRFLSNSALTVGTLAGAGALLDACDTSTASTTATGGGGGKTTLTIMGNAGEITLAYIKEFEKLNPTIKVNFLTFDQTRLNAMFAASSPPDIIRGMGFDSPYNSARGLALSLDPYLEKSTVLKKEDLVSIQDMWRWDGKQVGQGPYYGLAKDWSLDGTLWCNTALFKKAGLATISTTDPITYDQLLAISKKLAVKQGGKIQAYGVDITWPNGDLGTANLYQMIAQQNGRVFSDDLTQADFTTPAALKSLQYYVDYAQAHIGPTPLDPDPNGWDGPTFQAGRMGIAQDGYWFGGEIGAGTKDLQANALLAPTPLMGSKRISSCYAGTGIWIAANSKNKDAAWKFMEYFIAGPPAQDRAKGGWGISSLKSLVSQMPQDLPYQKQAYQTMQKELQYFVPLTVSPYATSTGIGTILDKYLQQAAKNQLTVSAAAQQITSDVNKLLQQGKQAIS